MLGFRHKQRLTQMSRPICQRAPSTSVGYAEVKLTCTLAMAFETRKADSRDMRSSLTALPLSWMNHACTPGNLGRTEDYWQGKDNIGIRLARPLYRSTASYVVQRLLAWRVPARSGRVRKVTVCHSGTPSETANRDPTRCASHACNEVLTVSTLGCVAAEIWHFYA